MRRWYMNELHEMSEKWMLFLGSDNKSEIINNKLKIRKSDDVNLTSMFHFFLRLPIYGVPWMWMGIFNSAWLADVVRNLQFCMARGWLQCMERGIGQ